MPEFDLLIRGALIVDGTGRPGFRGSIGIRNGKIVAVGGIPANADARRVLDAAGLVACPGFIDMHAHGDLTLLQYPEAESYVMQGVTTIVGGNCGFSPAPLKNVWLFQFWEYGWWHEIAPYKYMPEPVQPLDKVDEKFREKLGWGITWRSFGEFLSRVEEVGISINYVPLVGHNTIRATVMEHDYKRKAKPREIREMKAYVVEAMESGAFGLSTGQPSSLKPSTRTSLRLL